jgi:hypothetical protein
LFLFNLLKLFGSIIEYFSKFGLIVQLTNKQETI